MTACAAANWWREPLQCKWSVLQHMTACHTIGMARSSRVHQRANIHSDLGSINKKCGFDNCVSGWRQVSMSELLCMPDRTDSPTLPLRGGPAWSAGSSSAVLRDAVGCRGAGGSREAKRSRMLGCPPA